MTYMAAPIAQSYMSNAAPRSLGGYGSAMPRHLYQQMEAPSGSARYYDTRGYGAQEDEAIHLDSYQAERIAQPVQVYSASQKTTEYKERTYFFQNESYRNFHELWLHFLDHFDRTGTHAGFYSPNYIHACVGNRDSLAILSVIDLPFKSKQPRYNRQQNDLVIELTSPAVIFSKEIINEKADRLNLDVLVSQRFYDPHDQYFFDEENGGARIEKPVTEYIKGKVYESRVVITNSSTTELDLSLIYEVPQGSIPIKLEDHLNLKTLKLQPLGSTVETFSFYFPLAGRFSIYPATVVKDKHIVATAAIAKEFDVKEMLTIKKTDTIVDILSTGSVEDIIEFVRTKNILNAKIFQFNQIYWLLKNKDFYHKFIDVLRERGVYDQNTWNFAFFHGDIVGVREFFSQDSNKNTYLSGFKSLQNDFVSVDKFSVREYFPLVNPRAYSIGTNRENIQNVAFKKTYKEFLEYLVDKWRLDAEDKVVLTNYLILQDRMDDAILLHASITSEQVAGLTTRIQYDYLTAYLDFVNGYPKFDKAKEITGKYLVYPVLNWRNLFIEIANQLAEYEEREAAQQIIEGKKENNQDKAQKSPTFRCEIDKDTIKIESQRVNSLTVKFYRIDLEVLFSRNPFMLTNSVKDKSFTHILPFLEQVVPVQRSDSLTSTLVPIPKNLLHEPMFIEVNHNEDGSTASKILDYTPFTLVYTTNQEFGIVKIIDPVEKKPVPKIYVKCFAKYKNDSVAFYKDGYTDIRGSFDYAALNTDKLDNIKEFSILIVTPNNGNIIFTVEPPVKIGRDEGVAVHLKNKTFENIRQTNVQKGAGKYNSVY